MGSGGRSALGVAKRGTEYVHLLVLFVEQILQLSHLGFQLADSLLQRLGVAARKGAPAQLVAGPTLEADRGALRAGWPHAIAPDLLASAAIARLGDATLGAVAHLDDLHGEDARHDCDAPRPLCGLCWLGFSIGNFVGSTGGGVKKKAAPAPALGSVG